MYIAVELNSPRFVGSWVEPPAPRYWLPDNNKDGYASLTHIRRRLTMVFIESPRFSVWRDRDLADELFYRLLATLEGDPGAGALIPGGRGLRKIRIAMSGRGKRGGARVIYFYWTRHEQIFLVYGYAKNQQGDLTRTQLARLAELMREEIDHG